MRKSNKSTHSEVKIELLHGFSNTELDIRKISIFYKDRKQTTQLIA
jgi:hypothetical protein